jgi:hypothetical protein
VVINTSTQLVKHQWGQVIALCLLMCGINYLLHTSPEVDTMLSKHNNGINNAYLQEAINYHKQVPTFARRPLGTYAIEALHSITSLTIGLSFIVVNYSALLLTSIVLYVLSRKHQATHLQGLGNIVAFHLCFSTLFLFAIPIYGYDEPLQYLFITLALLAFHKNAWVYFTISLALALIARESTIILLPSILWLQYSKQKLNGYFAFVLSTVIALILFALSQYLLSTQSIVGTLQAEHSSRQVALHFNTQSQMHAVESAISLIVVIALPIWLIMKSKNTNFLGYKVAFILACLINTYIVLYHTQAREARLYALPLLLFWPIAMQQVGHLFLQLKPSIIKGHIVNNKMGFAIAIFASYLLKIFAWPIYLQSIGHDGVNYFNEYLLAYGILFIWLVYANSNMLKIKK